MKFLVFPRIEEEHLDNTKLTIEKGGGGGVREKETQNEEMKRNKTDT